MKFLHRALCFVPFALPVSAAAISPDSTNAREIMNAVEARDTGDRVTARLQITIADKAGRERNRVVQTWAMEVEGGRRQLMLFAEPPDVRNAGLLSFDRDGSEPDDQWLFLPSVGRITRIASTDKSGSFMGTDLSYADMTSKDIDAYDYVLVEAAVTVGGEDCWVIEAKPTTEKGKSETGYLKTQSWISKSKLLPVQTKAWVIEGKRLKYLKFQDIRQVDGLWIAHKIVVRTMRNKELESSSTLVFSDFKLNQEEVTGDIFSERRLEQGL
jgi:hypothetical protein